MSEQMLTFGEKKLNSNLNNNMLKFQQRLKETYNALTTEHFQDQEADNRFKFLIKHYLMNVMQREEFTEYNLPQIVDRIFEIVQQHISETQPTNNN